MTEKQTEQKILEAARKLFTQKGMGATRMQEIADEAGINKALLHYYFRSKQKLFEHTFKEAFGKIRPKLQVLVESDLTIEERITSFVNEYYALIEENRYLPLFILQEVQRDPGNLYGLMISSGFDPRQMLPMLAKPFNVETGQMLEIIINTISLVAFPFIAQPLMTHIFFKGDSDEYEKMLTNRRESIAAIIIQSLKNK